SMSSRSFFPLYTSPASLFILSLHDALPIFHLYFNVIGTITFLILFFVLQIFISMPFLNDSINEFYIAVVHTVFNVVCTLALLPLDRKSTRLNSSHVSISYPVFCVKKENRRV